MSASAACGGEEPRGEQKARSWATHHCPPVQVIPTQTARMPPVGRPTCAAQPGRSPSHLYHGGKKVDLAIRDS
eukprot:4567843-Pyramimonas_sp.AAC.1